MIYEVKNCVIVDGLRSIIAALKPSASEESGPNSCICLNIDPSLVTPTISHVHGFRRTYHRKKHRKLT